MLFPLAQNLDNDVFKVLTPVQKGALDKTMDKLLASVIDE